MKTYTATLHVQAKPMTRLAYNKFRGWDLPKYENGDDEGYICVDAQGASNTEKYVGHVNWLPSEFFKKQYSKT